MKYFKLLILTLLASMMTSSCECPTECERDISPPSSMILFPIENDYVMGTVEVTCMISDDEGILKVELWVDGIFSGLESTEEPYTFQWSTDQLEDNSRHTLVARAFDINGNVTDSAPVGIIVIQNSDIQVIQELMVRNFIMDDLLTFINKYCSFIEVEGSSRLYSMTITDAKKIFVIPESFGSLEELETLKLPEQEISSLPDEFGNLNNLASLELSSNALTSLSESFGNLTNLDELDLENNALALLPESFGDLSSLYILELGYNGITSLPESFVNLSSLYSLDLEHNELTSLPESLGNLSSLEFLYLSENKLTSLPETIGDLSALGKLELSYNELTSLPASFGNLLELGILHLEYNELTSLPVSFVELSELRSLNLMNNHLYCVEGAAEPPQWLIDFCDPFFGNGYLYMQDC